LNLPLIFGWAGISGFLKVIHNAETVLEIVVASDIKSDGTDNYVDLGNGFNLYGGADGTNKLQQRFLHTNHLRFI